MEREDGVGSAGLSVHVRGRSGAVLGRDVHDLVHLIHGPTPELAQVYARTLPNFFLSSSSPSFSFR